MNLLTRLIYKCFLLAGIISFAACNPSKRISNNYTYFTNDTASHKIIAFTPPTIQPNDLLSIKVLINFRVQKEEADVFNLPNSSTGSASGATGGNGYLVSPNGFIVFPRLTKKVKAAGLTCDSLSKILQDSLKNYIPGALVDVRFLEFKIKVLGEVKAARTLNYPAGNPTIIDALTESGDLTEYGRRENVKIIRTIDNKLVDTLIDLRSMDIFQSQFYYLRQNDVVYVEPNSVKKKTQDINPKAQRNLQLGLAIASFIALVANLVVSFK